MREIKYEHDGKEETIYVESAAGYNDGYYWECSATVIFNNVEYSIQDAGSGSGYIPHYRSISNEGPRKLVSLMQLCEDHSEDDYINDWGYIEDAIIGLLEAFFEYNCKTSYEEVEEDFWETSIHVDGKKIEDDEETEET